jgi:hypothetical protein
MTTTAEHSATVLAFTGATLRVPNQRRPHGKAEQHRTDGPLPDNVIVLARFTRRAHRHHWLGGPPEGEAA